MLTKIIKIKNLGLLYKDYSSSASLSSFKRLNLIYGWNGSGKTTLSRLFDAIENGSKQSDLEFEVEDEQGQRYKQGESFNRKIRVFNQDYIKKNIKILEGRANSISILLGQENKEALEDIQKDEAVLNGDPTDVKKVGKNTLKVDFLKDKENKEATRNARFTEIAKTIGAAIGGNALRDYRKPQAEKDFLALKSKIILNENDLNNASLVVKQISLASVDILSVKKIVLQDQGQEIDVSDALSLVVAEVGKILNKTVQVKIIDRLIKNADISKWVEDGMLLHEKHGASVCEYCGQGISPIRLTELAQHFTEADKELKSGIDKLSNQLKSLRELICSIKTPDKARLYEELQENYTLLQSDFELKQKMLCDDIDLLIQDLISKRDRTTETISPKMLTVGIEFFASFGLLNKLLIEHNEKSKQFNIVKDGATKKLKIHWLSTIFDEINGLNVAIENLKTKISILENGNADIKGDLGIVALEQRIADNKRKISSSHKACDDINIGLSKFLGHSEILFEPATEEPVKEGGFSKIDNGYLIKHGDALADNLSEGEKTAIAFVYFVVHLNDQGFSSKDGLIVIDDPISSLDSNSIFQAFSFLKNAVNGAHQVFVLTHNFDFLKLLMNWAKRDKSEGSVIGFMIKNNLEGNGRKAFLDKMDKELWDYESEYHYLFKLLKEMRDEQDGTIERSYPVAHIARKVLDTFLMFQVPNGGTPYSKIKVLKDENAFDVQKLDAIYKFTNHELHITGAGFDPALVPETKKNVEHIIDMIKTIAPRHFNILDKATN